MGNYISFYGINTKTGGINKKCPCLYGVTNPEYNKKENPKIKEAEISAIYAKAEINMQKSPADIFKSVLNEKFIDENEKITRINNNSKNSIRIKIGKELENYKGLYKDSKSACGYYDKFDNPKELYILDEKTNNVNIYDFESGKTKHYTSDEMKILKEYKYHPEAIHLKLRHNKDKYSGDWKEETLNTISNLTKLFNDENKTSTTKESIKLYRALQPDLTEEDKQKLFTIGDVFTEKSFCSTTTNENVANLFSLETPIMEIEFPKNSKYIDIDKLFNIDREHWKESEYLLNRNSQFLITGYDKENNTIKALYLGHK